jgi:hypothetical protein
MRPIVMLALLAPVLLGTVVADAATQDGNWSVLIITESGGCDRGYRYEVNVSNGRVTYRGDAAVDLAGTVAPSGAVKVTIKVGEQGANGTGHIAATSGTGTWRGRSANSECMGRWEAERR